MSAIVRRPGGAIVPYRQIDERRTNPDLVPSDTIAALSELAEPLRDEYCAIADALPTAGLFGGPINRALINRSICAPTANPRPPVRGQCPGVIYDVFGTVFGFNTAGAPLRTTFTSVGVTGLWGEVLDARISGFAAGRWSLEVLCRGRSSNAITVPGNYVWVGIGNTGAPNTYSQVLGAQIESWYVARRDGLPDTCGNSVLPPPITINPGQPVFTLPAPRSRALPDVEIEVFFDDDPDLIFPRFTLDVGGAQISAEFTLEGIEFNVGDFEIDLSTEIGGNIVSQVNSNLEVELGNQTTAIELSLSSQIEQQNQFIEEQNNELELELASVVESAIELSLGNVSVDVDLTPVLIEIDNLSDQITQECDCEPCDLTPVLERLNELDEKFSERLDVLESNILEAIAGLKEFLECWLRALWENTKLAIPDGVQELGSFSSDQLSTVNVFSVPVGAIAVGMVVTGYDERFVRVYKLDDDPMEIEAGFGHCSLLSQGGILSFDLVSTRRVTLAVPSGLSVGGFRVSLKPGVAVRAFCVNSVSPEIPSCE